MPLKDTKDIKWTVEEPLALRDEERFQNGPGVFDSNQGDEGTNYLCKCRGGEDIRTCTGLFHPQKLG